MSCRRGMRCLVGRRKVALMISFPLLLMAPTPASADANLGRYANRNLDVEGLLLDWQSYQFHTVSVEGVVHCVDDYYCAFSLVTGFHQIVGIDISMLPAEDKRHLLLDCRETPCNVVVTGNVMDDNLLALSVSDSVNQ